MITPYFEIKISYHLYFKKINCGKCALLTYIVLRAVLVNEPKMDKTAVGVQRDCFTRKSCQKLITGKSCFKGTWDSKPHVQALVLW